MPGPQGKKGVPGEDANRVLIDAAGWEINSVLFGDAPGGFYEHFPMAIRSYEAAGRVPDGNDTPGTTPSTSPSTSFRRQGSRTPSDRAARHQVVRRCHRHRSSVLACTTDQIIRFDGADWASACSVTFTGNRDQDMLATYFTAEAIHINGMHNLFPDDPFYATISCVA